MNTISKTPSFNYTKYTKKEKIELLIKHIESSDLSEKSHLAPLELKIFIKFLELDERYNFYRFSTICKKLVMKSLKEEDINYSLTGINNKLYAIQKKGWLQKDEDNQFCISKDLQMMLNKLEHNQLTIILNF